MHNIYQLLTMSQQQQQDTMLNNLLGTDGNMIDSNTNNKADGWGYDANVNSISCVNNEAVFIVTASNLCMSHNFATINGHIYYCCAYVNADSTSIQFRMWQGTWQPSTSHSATPGYDFLSLRYAVATTSSTINIYDTKSSGFTNISVKKAYVFDLTQIFGAGNEPTKATMDTWMNAQESYFVTKSYP